MRIELGRFAYAPTETEGVLYAKGLELATIERPWIAAPDHHGGMSFESCVPDGIYKLKPHLWKGRTQSWALINPELDVYYQPDDMPGPGLGRYAVLIHPANYVTDVVGCIGPGQVRTIYNNRRMVTNSRNTMQRLIDTIGWKPHTLEIYTDCGTQ